MLVLTLLSTCAGVGLSLKANATAHASKGTTFMIISGITSGSEMCLTAAGPQGVCMQDMLNVFLTRISRVSISGGDSPILLPCLESIGAGEGSELWTFEAAGALKTATGAKCVQVLTELNHTLDFPLYKQIDLSFLKSVISFIYAL